jgi:hypothetical protein
MKQKKSQGHIEMILSMALFIGAIIFLFIFLRSITDKKENNNSYNVRDIILKNITIKTQNEDIISKKEVINLKYHYEINYSNLKESLGMTKDFSFEFKDLNGNLDQVLSVSKDIPNSIEIKSIDIPLRIIDESGNIQEVILNIRSW